MPKRRSGSKAALYARVRKRARNRCEYCRLHQRHDPTPFHVEHIVAMKHRGKTAWNNLALSCAACNFNKSANVAGMDPATGQLTRLFHPRLDDWDQHFETSGPLFIGRTAVGRTTVAVLMFNAPQRVELRRLVRLLQL